MLKADFTIFLTRIDRKNLGSNEKVWRKIAAPEQDAYTKFFPEDLRVGIKFGKNLKFSGQRYML